MFLAATMYCSSFFAQDNSKFTKDHIPQSPEKTWTIVKNPSATDITIGNVIIPKRIAKYYQPGELENISQEKANFINYIYLKSYELITPKSQMNNECVNKFQDEFDASQCNYLRKQSDNVKIPVTMNGCKFEILLYSWDELEKVKSSK